MMPGVLSPFSNSITWSGMDINIYTLDIYLTVDVNWVSEAIITLLYSLLMAHKLLSVMIYHFKSHFQHFCVWVRAKKVHFWNWKRACLPFILFEVGLLLLCAYRPAAVDGQKRSEVQTTHQPEQNKPTLAGILCLILCEWRRCFIIFRPQAPSCIDAPWKYAYTFWFRQAVLSSCRLSPCQTHVFFLFTSKHRFSICMTIHTQNIHLSCM